MAQLHRLAIEQERPLPEVSSRSFRAAASRQGSVEECDPCRRTFARPYGVLFDAQYRPRHIGDPEEARRKCLQ